MAEDEIIFGIADRVKNQIYDDFERLIRQQSIVLSAKTKYKRHFAMKNFINKFLRFSTNIISTRQYTIIAKGTRDIIEDYIENLDKIQTQKDVMIISMNCALAIRSLNITNIGFTRTDNDAF